MNSLLICVILIGFAWFLWSLVYQYAIRYMLCDAVRFKIFALRDQLRLMAIDGEVERTSFSYQFLERKLCGMINVSSWISIGSFLEWSIRRPDLKEPFEAQRFAQKAPAELKAIDNRAVRILAMALAVNSPGWCLVFVALYPFAKLFGWAMRTWLMIRVQILSASFDAIPVPA